MESKIQFAASTWLWTSPFSTASVQEIFPLVASLGFDAVEIALEDPGLIDAARVKDGLRQFQLRPIVCGAFGPSRDLTNEDPEVQQHCLAYIEECLRLCKYWDAPFLAGPLYSAVGKARMLKPEKRKAEWNLAVKNLYTVCEMAAGYGLEIALEPLNRFESDLVNTSEDVCRLTQDIGHPAAKIMLDSFHMNIEETDPARAILRAGKKLIHVQVSENHRGIPGSGITPWSSYRKALREIGYQQCISIESFTPDNQELAEAVCIWRPFADSQSEFAAKGLAFLQDLFDPANP